MRVCGDSHSARLRAPPSIQRLVEGDLQTKAILCTAQEITDKAPELPDEIAWHFIGHLQSNKAKALLGGLLRPVLSAFRAL